MRQLILVRAPHWWSITATLQRYVRESATDQWSPVEDPIPVNLGRRGLAWGRGLHPSPKNGPSKTEGDGRSPAGVFELERAFGEAEALPAGSHGFPYLQTQPTSYCVEDIRSEHYNTLIDSTQVKAKGWERWSPLKRTDGLFRWGVVVRHNTPEIIVGAGSCVFLHIWRGPRQPTSGCTAMQADHLEAIIRWLDPKHHPVLVQLPEGEYRAKKEAWALP